MPTYTFRQVEQHQMTRTYDYQFDTSSKQDWAKLIKDAKLYDIDTSKLPKNPPKDPLGWMKLLDQLPISDLVDFDDDVWTLVNGSFDVSKDLLDEDGDEIA